MNDFEVHPIGTTVKIRQLKDALVVAVEALESPEGQHEFHDADAQKVRLAWLHTQVEMLV